MKLHDLKPAPGSRRTSKRIGRGHGSGKGKTGGKGMGGQKARSGPNPYPHFEGGQNPITQRMPYKRGFTNIFRVEYSVINVGSLNEWDGGEITPEALRDAGVIKNLKQPVKLLGDGDLNIVLNVRVHKVSASAKQKIEAAGGTVTLIEA